LTFEGKVKSLICFPETFASGLMQMLRSTLHQLIIRKLALGVTQHQLLLPQQVLHRTFPSPQQPQ
jgi:hypothetical protein